MDDVNISPYFVAHHSSVFYVCTTYPYSRSRKYKIESLLGCFFLSIFFASKLIINKFYAGNVFRLGHIGRLSQTRQE